MRFGSADPSLCGARGGEEDASRRPAEQVGGAGWSGGRWNRLMGFGWSKGAFGCFMGLSGCWACGLVTCLLLLDSGFDCLMSSWWDPRDSTLDHEKSRNAWPGNRWSAASSSLVCPRDLPVYQRRSVCPLVIPTHAMNQTVLRYCPHSELVSHRIRTNAKFCPQQQTSDYFQTVPAL